MPITRRVFVSMPADRWLTPKENELKWGVVEQIEGLGYKPEIFFDPRGKPGLAAAKAWSAREVDNVLRSCVAAAIIGMPRWIFPVTDGEINLPTEFCHYEGAVAYTLHLPMLVLVHENVLRRVVFDQSYDGYVGVFPRDAGLAWLATDFFLTPFGYWRHQLEQRRDVFLGYCSSSQETARALKQYLQDDLHATVLDWQTDFAPGRSILDQISEAAARCTAGLFLFTRDDKLTDRAVKNKAVPRDNVVFEAGYFISAKGKGRVLIVRESDAKMPADLGGDIYASLADKVNIEPVKDILRRFVDAL